MHTAAIDSIDFERRRRDMVNGQLVPRGIRDPRVLLAMGSVRRELFVPEEARGSAYADRAMPIGAGQTISQPYMVARTCEVAELRGHERVLEIGAGSGYQAAVLGLLAAEVISIERIPSLVQGARANLARADISNVEVLLGDGSIGWPQGAPYDVIIVAAAAPSVPPSLIAQLRVGGRLIIPVGSRQLQALTIIERQQSGCRQRAEDSCVYVPLIGQEGWADDGGRDDASG